MRTEELSLKNPMFNDAMVAADGALRMMMHRLMERGLSEGGMKLAVGMELTQQEVLDPGTGEVIRAVVPQITYKASYSINESESVSGRIQSESSVLCKNESGGWGISHIDPDQQSMFD